jgi:glutamyl-tRNA reductase
VTSLDGLAAVVGSAADRRESAARTAERVVDDAVDRLVVAERENRAEDVLRALHREAANVRATEVDRAKRRLRHGDADAETVLDEFASALTGQLLAAPTEALRAAARERDDEAIRAAERLFDLED